MEKSPSSERCPLADRRDVCNLSRSAARRTGEERRRLAGSGKVVPSLPFIHRVAERSAGATGHALRLVRSSSVQDFLGGAACLAMWGVLWLLFIFAVTSARENGLTDELAENPVAAFVPLPQSERPAAYRWQNLDAHTQIINVSAPVVEPPQSCGSGAIELDGRCVLGEEIEVRPPPTWRRR
jgi:hypothetical protein